MLLSGSGVVQNEKETMQDLNERLATYLEKVRSLENNNRRLEAQIRESLAKRGPSTRDWGNYWDTIQQLRDKVRGVAWDGVGVGMGMGLDCDGERNGNGVGLVWGGVGVEMGIGMGMELGLGLRWGWE